MTAVEWLTDKFYANEGIIKSEWLEKAKEMEKEIIAQAFEDGEYNYFYSKKTGDFEHVNGIEYYNEKYKSE